MSALRVNNSATESGTAQGERTRTRDIAFSSDRFVLEMEKGLIKCVKMRV